MAVLLGTNKLDEIEFNVRNTYYGDIIPKDYHSTVSNMYAYTTVEPQFSGPGMVHKSEKSVCLKLYINNHKITFKILVT